MPVARPALSPTLLRKPHGLPHATISAPLSDDWRGEDHGLKGLASLKKSQSPFQGLALHNSIVGDLHRTEQTTKMAETTKHETAHVEELERSTSVNKKLAVMGTVKLTEGRIVYIPTPTADPQGTLDSY